MNHLVYLKLPACILLTMSHVSYGAQVALTSSSVSYTTSEGLQVERKECGDWIVYSGRGGIFGYSMELIHRINQKTGEKSGYTVRRGGGIILSTNAFLKSVFDEQEAKAKCASKLSSSPSINTSSESKEEKKA